MNELKLSAAINIQAAADTSKRPTVSIMAYGGDVIEPGGWGPTVIDLSGLTLATQIPLLADHDPTLGSIAGHGAAEVRESKLWVSGTLTASTDAGNRILNLSKEGFRFQASVGVAPDKLERLRKDETATANGKTFTAGARGLTVVRAGLLREVSILSLGADATTAVSVAATKGKHMSDDNGNQTPAELLAARERKLDALRERYIAEHPERAATINATIEAAYDSDEDIGMVDVKLLRAMRPQRIMFKPSGTSRAMSGDILEASLALSSGIPEKIVGQEFGEQVMNAAVSREHRGATIHTLFAQVIRAAGMEVPSFKMTDSVIRTAFDAHVRLKASGFSTFSLPGVLGNVANKSMLAAFQAVPTTWQKFCATGSNSNFHEAKQYRLTGKGQYRQIGEGGELKHVSLDEDTFTTKLHTEGAMIALTREAIINDDMGAFTALPQILGRMSAIAIEKAVYTLLLSSGAGTTFFTSANANYDEGADTALQISALGLAETIFLNQTDGNGDPVMIEPKILLVPTTLQTTGRKVLADVTAVGDAGDTIPSVNPFAGKFELVVSPWMENSSLTGYSTKAWYLLTGPGDYAVIVVSFLNGQSLPTVESEAAEFNQLGMQWRSFHDFGVAFREYRGGVKMKGEN